MFKRSTILAAAAALALAGCVSPAERIDARCTSVGSPPGSSGFGDCEIRETAIEAQRQQEAATAMIAGLAILGSMQTGPSRLPAGAYQLSSPGFMCYQAGIFTVCQ